MRLARSESLPTRDCAFTSASLRNEQDKKRGLMQPWGMIRHFTRKKRRSRVESFCSGAGGALEASVGVEWCACSRVTVDPNTPRVGHAPTLSSHSRLHRCWPIAGELTPLGVRRCWFSFAARLLPILEASARHHPPMSLRIIPSLTPARLAAAVPAGWFEDAPDRSTTSVRPW